MSQYRFTVNIPECDAEYYSGVFRSLEFDGENWTCACEHFKLISKVINEEIGKPIVIKGKLKPMEGNEINDKSVQKNKRDIYDIHEEKGARETFNDKLYGNTYWSR